jgi:hypothetical protein
VGIGTYDRSLEFCKLTGFPQEFLYSDANNALYDALDLLKSSPVQLITDAKTPLAIAKRFKDGKGGFLLEALKTWKPWIPPKLDQGLQQGGAFVFNGETTSYGRKDPATGDHAGKLHITIPIYISDPHYLLHVHADLNTLLNALL